MATMPCTLALLGSALSSWTWTCSGFTSSTTGLLVACRRKIVVIIVVVVIVLGSLDRYPKVS